jgi:hypothetical protein
MALSSLLVTFMVPSPSATLTNTTLDSGTMPAAWDRLLKEAKSAAERNDILNLSKT